MNEHKRAPEIAEERALELVLFLRVPGAQMDDDPAAFALEISTILNEERRRNEGPDYDGGDVEVMFATWSTYQRRHIPPVEGCACRRCRAAILPCDNCGKTMAEHDALAHCWGPESKTYTLYSDGSGGTDG